MIGIHVDLDLHTLSCRTEDYAGSKFTDILLDAIKLVDVFSSGMYLKSRFRLPACCRLYSGNRSRVYRLDMSTEYSVEIYYNLARIGPGGFHSQPEYGDVYLVLDSSGWTTAKVDRHITAIHKPEPWPIS